MKAWKKEGVRRAVVWEGTDVCMIYMGSGGMGKKEGNSIQFQLFFSDNEEA